MKLVTEFITYVIVTEFITLKALQKLDVRYVNAVKLTT